MACLSTGTAYNVHSDFKYRMFCGDRFSAFELWINGNQTADVFDCKSQDKLNKTEEVQRQDFSILALAL